MSERAQIVMAYVALVVILLVSLLVPVLLR